MPLSPESKGKTWAAEVLVDEEYSFLFGSPSRPGRGAWPPLGPALAQPRPILGHMVEGLENRFQGNLMLPGRILRG